MSGVLWVSGEVRGWLTDLSMTDPGLARLTAGAVLALLDRGASLGPPLVVPVAEQAPPRDPSPADALDDMYQHLLELLTGVRRGVAHVATSRKRIEIHLGESQGAGADEIRARYAELTVAEERLTRESQRMVALVNDFHMRKEGVKAKYAAALAQRAVNEAYAMLGDEGGPAEVPFPGADDAVDAARAASAELMDRAYDVGEDLRGDEPRGGGRRGRRGRRKGPARPAEPEHDEPWLLSLRPAAPDCVDVRILCALRDGPGAPGTVLLLAAAADHARPPGMPDPLADNARARYWAMVAADPAPRPGRDAAPGEPAAYDRASFPRAFLPGEGPGLVAEAVDRGRPHRLGELRARAGLTQAQVAERLGVRQERISALERGELTAAEARTLAAYVAALGGHLEIIAEFGSARLFLG